MMKKLAAALLLPLAVTAQQEPCNCLDNLNQLVAKTEANYAGFPGKVTNANAASYNRLVQSIKQKATNITNPKACFYVLKEYIRFFKDKHFILSYVNEKDADKELIAITEERYRRNFATGKAASIEGIWVLPDASLKLAIQRTSAGIYKAIVLASADSTIPKGLVYATFTQTANGLVAKEYNSFMTTDIPARQRGNLLQIWNQQFFGRIFPTAMTSAEKEILNTWANNNKGLDFKKLSAKTAYLKIPSFTHTDDQIQQLVQQSDSIIRSCDNLIVDLTSNGGGNSGWIFFLPYFMTNPIVQYSSYVRVTPENVQAKLKDLEPFVVNPIPDEYKKYFPDDVLQAYKNAYRELPLTTKTFYPVPAVSFPLDTLLPTPRKIALLVDDYCGSSSEYFFFLSKQSKKTTTYGVNTIGMMDYEGMSTPTPLPYDKYIVTIPIAKSSWTDQAPIDQKGFRPDVLLNHIDPTKWVEHVRLQLEKN